MTVKCSIMARADLIDSELAFGPSCVEDAAFQLEGLDLGAIETVEAYVSFDVDELTEVDLTILHGLESYKVRPRHCCVKEIYRESRKL